MTDLSDPKQVVLVTARHDGKDNMIAIAWHSQASFHPLLHTIFIAFNRFSHDMISNSKVFTINYMSIDDEDAVMLSGTSSGQMIDKFKETGLVKEECDKIDCCRIQDALAYMECEVVDQVKVGDHTMFVGKVVKQKSKKDGRRILQIQGKFTTTNQ